MFDSVVIPFPRSSGPQPPPSLPMSMSRRRLPQVLVMSSDLTQRIARLADNQIEVTGALGSNATLTLSVDGRRATLTLARGLSAETTAVRLAAACPSGFGALVDGTRVTFWKDDDTLGMTA